MEEAKAVTRRRMLGGASAVAAAAALGPWSTSAAGQGGRRQTLLVPRQNIGIQLYSIRDQAEADLPGTLGRLGDIGFPEVEPFTLNGRSPAEFRALLDAEGIRAIGAHVGIDRWRGDLKGVLDEAETLGMPFVGLPGIFPPPPGTIENYRALARELNRFGAAAAERGIRFYYHNHDWEFAVDRGTVLYDVMLEDTDPDLVFFELDLYWIVTAGRNPLDYLRGGAHEQFRWPLFHVKDRATDGMFADLGEGTIDFGRILGVLENPHYHHYIVERDSQPDPGRTAQVGYEYLRALRGRRRHRRGAD